MITYTLYSVFCCYKQGCNKPESFHLCMCFKNEFPPHAQQSICMLNVSKLFSTKGACSSHPPATYEHVCFPMPANVWSNLLILVNEWKTLGCPSWLCNHRTPPWSGNLALALIPSTLKFYGDFTFFSTLLISKQKKFFFWVGRACVLNLGIPSSILELQTLSFSASKTESRLILWR